MIEPSDGRAIRLAISVLQKGSSPYVTSLVQCSVLPVVDGSGVKMVWLYTGVGVLARPVPS